MTEAAESATAELDWWRPGKSMREVHESSARVRWLIGGRGSAKTATAGLEAIRHGFWNAGAKVMFVRKTETSQSDTTIDTINSLFAKLGDLYVDTGDSLFASWRDGRTIRLPSKKAIEAFNAAQPSWQSKSDRMIWLENEGNKLCSFIEFRGLPSATISEGKLRGFECSMMVLVEADQLTEGDFQMAMPCLRWKGSDPETCDENGFILDSGIIVETNPPSPRHWIARIEEEWKRGEHPDYHFWHIKTAENSHNLPPNYVEDLKAVYRNNPAMYARMALGEYAEAYEGNAVYYAFKQDVHADEDLPWPRGAWLIRGWDFGTNNAVVWSAYWERKGIEYWHDMDEQYMEGSDTDRQAREAIRKTETDFPFWNDRSICSGVLDFCDPAGVSSAFTRKIMVNGKQVNESAINILRTYGINPGYLTTARGLQETIAIVNRLLEKRDGPTIRRESGASEATGNFVYKIDKKHCPILFRGFCGAYRYPNPGEPGYGNNEPMKGAAAENIDHCFTAGTMILTARGEVPVETVKEGDEVFTTIGLRKVVATMSRVAYVRDYALSNGTSLTATGDHPAWSEERGWISFQRLTQRDTLRSCRNIQRILSSTGSVIAATLHRIAGRIDSTSERDTTTCTGTFGNFTTGRFRKEITSTTRTATRSITTSETLSASQPKSTSEAGITPKKNAHSHARQSSSPSPQLPHGTHQTQAENGTPSTRGNAISEKWSKSEGNATIAGSNSPWQLPPEHSRACGSAPTRVNRRGVARIIWTTWIRFARFAASYFGTANTPERFAVHVVAVSDSGRRERVFNVSVEGQPEYFANGILVHNCQDAGRYSKINALRLLKAEIEQTKKAMFPVGRRKNPNPDRRQ